MKLFILNDTVIKEILNRLVIDDELRGIIDAIVLRFDYSFTNFIYSVFSVYTVQYMQLTDHNCSIPYNDIDRIYNNLRKTNLDIDRNNIFVADIYDVLYVASAPDSVKFKSHFYEDMYNRTENLFGGKVASDNMDELFDTLETVFSVIEESLILNLISHINEESNVVIYLELNRHGLMIYIT